MARTIMTYAEIAAHVRLSVRDIRRGVADGSIPHGRRGRRILFDVDEVWAALRAAGQAWAEQARARRGPVARRGRPDLAAILAGRAKHFYAVPDELAAKRAQREEGAP